MSRTMKDRPSKIRFPQIDTLVICKDTFGVYFKPYLKPKKKKREHTEWGWLGSTPSWWTNLFMNRPARHKYNQKTRQLVRLNPLDLEDQDIPNLKNKPHIYYY